MRRVNVMGTKGRVRSLPLGQVLKQGVAWHQVHGHALLHRRQHQLPGNDFRQDWGSRWDASPARRARRLYGKGDWSLYPATNPKAC